MLKKNLMLNNVKIMNEHTSWYGRTFCIVNEPTHASRSFRCWGGSDGLPAWSVSISCSASSVLRIEARGVMGISKKVCAGWPWSVCWSKSVSVSHLLACRDASFSFFASFDKRECMLLLLGIVCEVETASSSICCMMMSAVYIFWSDSDGPVDRRGFFKAFGISCRAKTCSVSQIQNVDENHIRATISPLTE